MKFPKILNMRAREILDSRGNPTVEVEIETSLGKFFGFAPSGASKGKREALELRDGKKRFLGKGVLKAVRNVNEILAKKLKGMLLRDQREIDQILIELDGTENKKRLGANAICPISIAACKAISFSKNLSVFEYIRELAAPQDTKYQILDTRYHLPRPSFNVINGGAHAGNDLDFQEFMVCPKAKSFSENLRIGCEIYYVLKDLISKKYGKQATNVGDEGGFAPQIKFPEKAIELILEAAKKLNYEKKISIILDVAASQFFEKGFYKTKFGKFSGKKLANYYLKLIKNYPIEAIEDPFSEEDLDSWKEFFSYFQSQNTRCQIPDTNFLIIGDDLLVTNKKMIELAKKENLCNGVIIKINQVGTVTEAIEAVQLAKSFSFKIVASHRSGETTDDFLADFSVGIFADYIKSGAPARGERVAKYNRLLEIEEKIKNL